MNNTLRWTILGGVFAGFTVFSLLMAVAIRLQGGDEGPGIVLGIVFAEVTLLAAWTALGSARLIIRAATGFVLAGLVFGSVLAFGLRSTSYGEALAIAAAVAVQWFVVQMPLWVARLALGFRICRPAAVNANDRVSASDRSNESQFGIGQLFVWILLVSILLGIARLALSTSGFSVGALQSSQFLIILVLLSAFNSLLAWPLIWGTLVARAFPLWLMLAPICGAVITVAEIWSFTSTMGGGGGMEIIWWLNISHGVAAGIGLLALRICGWRLIRVRGNLQNPLQAIPADVA